MDEVSYNRISTLHPLIRDQVIKIYEDANQLSIPIRVTSTYRDFDEQHLLYAKGRTEPGKIVTYADAGYSWHNYGLAFDFVLMAKDGKNVSWDLQRDLNDNEKRDWLEIVSIAKAFNFEWGGEWNTPDYPHFQKRFGLDISDAKQLMEDGNVDKHGYIKVDQSVYSDCFWNC